MNEINLHTWYQQREVPYCPQHFVKTRTVICKESLQWIKQKLVGRYAFVPAIDGEYASVHGQLDNAPAFEDPTEAILYELKWS